MARPLKAAAPMAAQSGNPRPASTRNRTTMISDATARSSRQHADAWQFLDRSAGQPAGKENRLGDRNIGTTDRDGEDVDRLGKAQDGRVEQADKGQDVEGE